MEPSALAVQPAGWTWHGTGENFGQWLERRTTDARNIWLRSMGIRLTSDNQNADPAWYLDLGDNGIAGIEVDGKLFRRSQACLEGDHRTENVGAWKPKTKFLIS